MIFGFTQVRPGCRWVHPCSFGLLGFALEVVGFVLVFGFTRVRSEGRWARPRSLGSLGFALVVVGFIRHHWGSSLEYLGYPGSLGSLGIVLWVVLFNQGLWVHSRSPLVFALVVVEFIRGCLVDSRSPMCTPMGFDPETLHSLWVALGFVGFNRGCWVHYG